MDFDPRDDSRDEERLNTRDGKAGSHGDLDRDDDLRLLDTRPIDRDRDDARTLGRGPGGSRQSNADGHSRDPRDDARWPDRDREPPDRAFNPREPFTRDLNLPRGMEREIARDRDRESRGDAEPRGRRRQDHVRLVGCFRRDRLRRDARCHGTPSRRVEQRRRGLFQQPDLGKARR